MKTPFIPTAMRCTQEQFEAIKPKLIERGIDVWEYEFAPYLVNNLFDNPLVVAMNKLSNIHRKVYEEWNEEIFLRNLGGEEIVPITEEWLAKQNVRVEEKPTYDRGMMAATILSAMITVGYATDTIHKDAVEHTDKLIDRLNQTL